MIEEKVLKSINRLIILLQLLARITKPKCTICLLLKEIRQFLSVTCHRTCLITSTWFLGTILKEMNIRYPVNSAISVYMQTNETI